MIYSSPEIDSDMYYATRFFAPDPVAYFKIKGKSYLWVRGLDEDRARNEASVDKVLDSKKITDGLKKKGVELPSVADFIVEISKILDEKRFIVPANFPVGLADKLRVKGIDLIAKEQPFFEQRVIKSADEVKKIKKAEKVVIASVDKIVEALSHCKIGPKNRLIYKGKPLTSEILRDIVETFLFSNGYLPWHTIIAGGFHGSEPHNAGSGPLFAHKPIVCDIFPRSKDDYYWGDFTRTFCVGEPSPALRKMYRAVKEANEAAIKMVKPKVNAKAIHEKVKEILESYGFKTEQRGGRWVGFFHGTGHGLGLDIHEQPLVSTRDYTLKKGEVFTIEPGLYYPEEGGVRIEDVVVVTGKGCEVLSNYPKQLEIKAKK